MSTVEIVRYRLARHRVAPGERVVRYTYSYRVDGGREIGYGEHLASLRDMVKRKFPGAVVVDSWKVRGEAATAV